MTDMNSSVANTRLFQPIERCLDGFPEGRDIAELMAEHERETGQEQGLALGAGGIDRGGERLVDSFEIVKRHFAHGVCTPRQMRAVRRISSVTTVFQRPAMCRSGRKRYSVSGTAPNRRAISPSVSFIDPAAAPVRWISSAAKPLSNLRSWSSRAVCSA